MSIIDDSNKYVLNTYSRYPLVFDHGEDVWLYTEDGGKYLDMYAGVAVSSLGHNHPNLINAIQEQSKKILHTSNLYYTKPYTELAKKLIEKTVFDKVFFCNSGAEANEAALKITRKHGKNLEYKAKYEVIALNNSFHGRTIATLSATGQKKYQKGFEPLLEGFIFVEMNNKEELKRVVSSKTAAILIEPIQGEGGIHPAFFDFIETARKLCDEYNAILIFDEVQSAIGRTGKLFGYENFLPVEPDIITIAKGLGGGLPIGAILIKEKFADLLKPSEHASTFGGNPVCCAAANAVLDTIDKENILKNVKTLGEYFRNKLNKLKEKYSFIIDVRGMGLLNGIELKIKVKDIIEKLLEKNIVTIPAGANVIRFLPPLIVKKEHIDTVITALDEVFKSF